MVVRVDGEAIGDARGVATDYSIGRAASFTTETAPGVHAIEVEVASRQASATREVRVADALYVGVSIEGERIGFRLSEAPFVYY